MSNMATSQAVGHETRTSGVLYGLASAVLAGLAAVLIHVGATNVPTSEIAFSRAIFGLIATLPLVFRDISSLVRLEMAPLWIRGAAGAVSIQCFTWNLQNTTIGMTNVLFNTSLVAVLCLGFYRGDLKFRRRLTIDMMLVAFGSCFFWYTAGEKINYLILVIGLVGATSAAVAQLYLKQATRVADPWLINWVVCLTGLPLAFLTKMTPWVVADFEGFWVLATIGLLMTISHYLLNLSFAKLPVYLAAAIVPSCIVWSVVVHEFGVSIDVAWHQIFGAAVYAVGLAGLIHYSTARQKRFAPVVD